jgi:hypothetical protein
MPVEDEVVIVKTAEIANALAESYRNGWADHRTAVETKLRDILAQRKAKSATYSQTIGIEEAIELLGQIK